MEKNLPDIETRYDELIGTASVNFNNDSDFNGFAEKVANIDTAKYQPLLMRVYISASPVVTIYASLKDEVEQNKNKEQKLKVQKFKVTLSLEQLFSYIKQIDFTLTTGEINPDKLEVIN